MESNRIFKTKTQFIVSLFIVVAVLIFIFYGAGVPTQARNAYTAIFCSH